MPASFGDVTGEYLAARRAAGLVEGHHDLVWVRGPDAIPFLEGLVTQEVAGLPPGSVARSMLLSPRGKFRALLWMLRGEDEVGLLVDAGFAHVVVSDLERFKIRIDAVLEGDPRPLSELWGPGAAPILENAGLLPPSGWARMGEVVVACVPLGGLQRYALVGMAGAALLEAGATPVGDLAATAVRVEAGEPRTGRDLDTGVIPQETGLEVDTISFTKGCYLGQELVARIASRGHVNRHLRGVVLTTNVLPPEPCDLWAQETMVGKLTSIAESLTLRAPIGLGLIRREVEPGDLVVARWPDGSAGGRVAVLPLDDFTDS